MATGFFGSQISAAGAAFDRRSLLRRDGLSCGLEKGQAVSENRNGLAFFSTPIVGKHKKVRGSYVRPRLPPRKLGAAPHARSLCYAFPCRKPATGAPHFFVFPNGSPPRPPSRGEKRAPIKQALSDHPQPPQRGLPPPVVERRQIGTRGHESAQVDVAPAKIPPEVATVHLEGGTQIRAITPQNPPSRGELKDCEPTRGV